MRCKEAGPNSAGGGGFTTGCSPGADDFVENFRKYPLAKQRELCYCCLIKIEVADATNLREPTGWERRGSNSAESCAQVWTWGGDGENISATVHGGGPRGCAICSP